MEKLVHVKTGLKKIDLKKLRKEIGESDTFFKSWLIGEVKV